jgi:hypothetical protein
MRLLLLFLIILRLHTYQITPDVPRYFYESVQRGWQGAGISGRAETTAKKLQNHM